VTASEGGEAGAVDSDSDSDPPALAVTDLRKAFGGVVAVDGASFEGPDGSVTGVVGPNGAGKTTTFDLVSGTLPADGGRVLLDGDDIGGLSAPDRTLAGLGRTFQTPRVFGGMTVHDNLRFAATGQTGESITGALFRPGTTAEQEAAVTDRARSIAEFLEIDHLLDAYARGLSGGQRKLLGIGRVLMLDPSVMLLDEPAAGVNPALTDRIVDRLHAINDDGTTVVLIEHDMELVMNHCDRVVVLHDGKTLAVGEPDAVQADDRVMEVYLGGT
jgi:branched-chain amino acid transport system ATP-binding protein